VFQIRRVFISNGRKIISSAASFTSFSSSGYTSSAGFCYVGAYQENGVTLIAAVMGGRGRNMAWTDLKRLFAYGMAVNE